VLTVLMAPAGLLLVVAGIVDLQWWSTPDAARLVAIFTQLRISQGFPAPALLRNHGEAVELIVIGAVCLAYAVLAPLIYKGRRGALNWAMAFGFGTALVGLVGIGVDASTPIDLKGYLTTLANAAVSDPIPAIKALVYPAWYAWLEDTAQGLQTLLSFAGAVTLVGAVVWHPEHFAGKGSGSTPPDAWDAAISRIREQNARERNRYDDEPE